MILDYDCMRSIKETKHNSRAALISSDVSGGGAGGVSIGQRLDHFSRPLYLLILNSITLGDQKLV